LGGAILAVVAGIYVIGRGSGNVDAGLCEPSLSAAAALRGLNIGPVAAFVPQEKPVSLAGLAFDDAAGSRRSLAQWQGRTVLLNLWATWCAPCREEMPSLLALQAGLGGDQFEVVPVSIDLGGPEKPQNFYAENNLAGLGFFHDGKLGVFNELKRQGLAFGMPVSLLIDRNGCVLGSLNGPADWASSEAKALISKSFTAK
jgi:thiol-disulfide isomerase/thioredoxin